MLLPLYQLEIVTVSSCDFAKRTVPVEETALSGKYGRDFCNHV